MADCVSTWDKCLEYIGQNITMSTYKTWFEPLKPLKIEDNTLTLEVPSKYFVETLEKMFIKNLSGALRSVIGPHAQLMYKVKVADNVQVTEPSKGDVAPKLPDGYPNVPRPNVGDENFNPFAHVGIQHRLNVDPQLNENFTFDNYIEGECNKLAGSVAHAIAEKPGETPFNPFFIYGNSGVGKTHLIQAIGAEVKRRSPQKNVIYLSANRFMRQYMDATKENNIPGFIKFFQQIDVLIVDDVQELAGKTGTELVFFQIFNHLQQNNKQIVMAADKKPIDIMGLEERLLTRFKAGMIVEIQTPDYDTRVGIIKKKMAKDGIELPNDVIDYIASNLTTNVREIEGSLVSLLARATLTHCDVTMEVARSVVSNLVKNDNKEISVESIVNVVCEHYGIDNSVLQKNSRKREIVMARQIAMYLSKELTTTSLSTIGAKLGNRNHSTVLYACKSIADQLETDKDFERNIKQIESKIRS